MAPRVGDVRLCKWCEKPAKKNITKEGRNKGYYRTCGSEVCVKQQYKNSKISKSKGQLKKVQHFVCKICNVKTQKKHHNEKYFCRECVPDQKWRLKAYRYGIGKKQWDEMFTKQKGKCALCEKTPEVVDHCHKKATIRGLLCLSCNMTLGLIEKDPVWFEMATKYKENNYAIPITKATQLYVEK